MYLSIHCIYVYSILHIYYTYVHTVYIVYTCINVCIYYMYLNKMHICSVCMYIVHVCIQCMYVHGSKTAFLVWEIGQLLWTFSVHVFWPSGSTSERLSQEYHYTAVHSSMNTRMVTAAFLAWVKRWKPPVFSRVKVTCIPYVHDSEYPSEAKSLWINHACWQDR